MKQNESSIYPCIISKSVDVANKWQSEYQIRFGNKVKYLTIAAATFDRDAMSSPLASLPLLPYNDDDWTMAYVSRDAESGELRTTLSARQLAGVQNVWHNTQVDVLDLEMRSLSDMVYEAVVREATDSTIKKACTFSSQAKAVAKIARSEWEIPHVEQETRAYQILQHKDPTLAPRFLGHIREGDRVIGLLIEKLEGRKHASIDDLRNCEKALEKFYNLDLLHGDVNRYNFLVGDDEVTLIDFENFKEDPTEEEKLL